MTVHNHGAEEGAGLLCNEMILPSGERRGTCVITDDELATVRVVKKHSLPNSVIDTAAEKVLYDFITSIPAVRIRADADARARGRKVDLQDPATIISAAVEAKIFGRGNLLALVNAALSAKPTMTAEEAWAEHSIGMVWDSAEHRYGEYRQFLAGFEYRDGLSA